MRDRPYISDKSRKLGKKCQKKLFQRIDLVVNNKKNLLKKLQ
jgi:hypothetical protein